MARVNLEERFFADKRFRVVAKVMGWHEDRARMRAITLWHQSQESLAHKATAQQICDWSDVELDEEDKLIEAYIRAKIIVVAEDEIAESEKDKLYEIIGNKVQIDSRVSRIDGSAKGGLATKIKWEQAKQAKERKKMERRNLLRKRREAAKANQPVDNFEGQNLVDNFYPQPQKTPKIDKNETKVPNENFKGQNDTTISVKKTETNTFKALGPSQASHDQAVHQAPTRLNSMQFSAIQPSIKMDGKTRARDEPDDCDEFAAGQDVDDFLAGKPDRVPNAKPNQPSIKNKNFDGSKPGYVIVSKAKEIELLFHDKRKGPSQFVERELLNPAVKRFFDAGRNDNDWSNFRSWLSRLSAVGVALNLERFDEYVNSWDKLRDKTGRESAGNNSTIDVNPKPIPRQPEKKIEAQKGDSRISDEVIWNDVVGRICGLKWAKKDARPIGNNAKENHAHPV